MRNIFLAMTRNSNRFGIFCYVKALFLFLLMSACFASSLTAGQVGQPSPVDNMNFPDSQGIRNGVMTSGDACPTKEEIVQKTRTLQMPFIANNGQMDEQVRFYAKTFGGTVFVTKKGEIVYSLPSGRDVPAGASQESGRSLKHGVCRDALHASLYYVGQGSRGAEEQGGKVVSGWHGQAPLVRAESEFVVAYAYSPLFRADNANCPPDRVFTKSLIAAYLPGLPVETTRRDVCPSSMLPNQNPKSDVRGIALKETILGAKIGGIAGEQPAVTTVNYFIGNDASKWKTNIPTYNVVNLGDIYKGIELSLKAYGNNVEKLFCVKPGADPCRIKIGLSGVKERGLQNRKSEFQISTLQINTAGELVAETEFGSVRFTKPVAYQEREGKRVYVAVDYSISVPEINEDERWKAEKPGGGEEPETQNMKPETDNSKLTYGFTVASYDKTKDLIIDPLLASTYLGGSGDEYGNSIVLDTRGNVYVTGTTWSTNFPTTSGAYDNSYNGDGGHFYERGGDVFVSKLDGGLTSLLVSTYLGGSSDDVGYSLAFDTSGNVYVTGTTWSTDFPTTRGVYDDSFNGGRYRSDAFVSKLDSGLATLQASMYLGGSEYEE